MIVVTPIIWNGCMNEPVWFLRWIECHPGLAGYIQAAGTVIAVLVALYAPRIASWFEYRQWRAKCKARTQMLLESLGMPVAEVGVRAVQIKIALARQTEPPASQEGWNVWFDTVVLRLPAGLDYWEQKLEGTDPDATLTYRNLADAVRSYNETCFKIRNIGSANAGYEWELFLSSLDGAIGRVGKVLNEVERAARGRRPFWQRAFGA